MVSRFRKAHWVLHDHGLPCKECNGSFQHCTTLQGKSMGIDCDLTAYCPAGPPQDAEGEDDNAPSPRTLRAAAERLAQYTTEQPETGSSTQGQGFADIYSEVHSGIPWSAQPESAGLQSCPGGVSTVL